MTKQRQASQLTNLPQRKSQLPIVNEEGVGGIAPPLAEGTEPRCVDVVPKHRQGNTAVHTRAAKDVPLPCKHVAGLIQLMVMISKRKAENSIGSTRSLSINQLLTKKMGERRCSCKISRQQRRDVVRPLITKNQTTSSKVQMSVACNPNSRRSAHVLLQSRLKI
jgi:hypothetical protein